jgi:hypothetical protein
MTLTKYNGETKPKLWLADFRLACQLGGAIDDWVIIWQLVSASSPLVGFGELNDNAIKDLTKFAKC